MISDAELQEIINRCKNATPGPWVSFVEGRDHESGSSFIQTPEGDIELPGTSIADQDFIAHSRTDVPKLIEEIRRLQQLV